MFGVDEFGVLLDQLPVVEESPKGPDPASRNGVVLEDVGPDPVVLPKAVGASESGDSPADDDDPSGALCSLTTEGVGGARRAQGEGGNSGGSAGSL